MSATLHDSIMNEDQNVFNAMMKIIEIYRRQEMSHMRSFEFKTFMNRLNEFQHKSGQYTFPDVSRVHVPFLEQKISSNFTQTIMHAAVIQACTTGNFDNLQILLRLGFSLYEVNSEGICALDHVLLGSHDP